MSDLTGTTVGRLTVIERAPPPPNVWPVKDAYWRCTCTCGGEKVVATKRLRDGRVKSCGCLTDEQRKHREVGITSAHPLYGTWIGMRNRCENPNHPSFHRYGGRGIRVCERWKVFANFVADMGEKPSPVHSVDRIDNDGDYAPGNVRWATSREQNQNRQPYAAIDMDGEKISVADAAHRLGMSEQALRGLAGLTLQQVVDRLVAQRAPASH